MRRDWAGGQVNGSPQLQWGSKTFIMGVINVTPDSFSGDGVYDDPDAAGLLAERLVAEGAAILDVGGESTRPGYTPVSGDEEMRRVLPAIERIVARVGVPISVDTTKADVAAAALEAGATMVNDVSGLADPRMPDVVAAAGAHIIVVHSGWPAGEEDPVGATVVQLAGLVARAQTCGVDAAKVLVDPGLGMGKGWKENFAVLRRLPEFAAIGKPLVVGPSRKGMIGKALGAEVSDRIEGTIALVVLSVAGGADVVRVHDVRQMTRIAAMADKLARGTHQVPG